MHSSLFSLAILSSLMLSLQSCGQQEASSQLILDEAATTRIDTLLRGMVQSGKLAGASAIVWEKGAERYFGAFGMADRDANIEMSRNTIARIYSMTKPITGVALMKLWEDGALKLDDLVEWYVPELAGLQVYTGVDSDGNITTEPQRRRMTIRDLTRNTAGFYNGGDDPGIGALWEKAGIRDFDKPLSDFGNQLARAPLFYQPGEKWIYGIAVDVEALIIERVSGKPFYEFVRETVLDPLGMNETRYVVPESDRNRFMAEYDTDDDGMLQQRPQDPNSLNLTRRALTPGAYGLTSTLDDYLRFTRMLLNGGELDGVRILAPYTVRIISTSNLSDSVTDRSWLPGKGEVGFGINVAVRVRPPASAEENPGTVGEFFWDGAASTLFWVDPLNDLTAVLFVQLFPFDQIGLHHGFRRAVYGPYTPVE